MMKIMKCKNRFCYGNHNSVCYLNVKLCKHKRDFNRFVKKFEKYSCYVYEKLLNDKICKPNVDIRTNGTYYKTYNRTKGFYNG
jgi:hypothetical protein